MPGPRGVQTVLGLLEIATCPVGHPWTGHVSPALALCQALTDPGGYKKLFGTQTVLREPAAPGVRAPAQAFGGTVLEQAQEGAGRSGQGTQRGQSFQARSCSWGTPPLRPSPQGARLELRMSQERGRHRESQPGATLTLENEDLRVFNS